MAILNNKTEMATSNTAPTLGLGYMEEIYQNIHHWNPNLKTTSAPRYVAIINTLTKTMEFH
jgi:hypothetical protein